MSKLVIVESPAKAKTIKKYLGGDYQVIASMGHIRDLPKSQMGIDINDNFKPRYINIPGKAPLIKELKEMSESSDEVFLATDPDREGEAISWHLAHLLKLDTRAKNRVTFGEITKKGITEGMANVRTIDMDLVNAQQARRVMDRIVGYRLSPFLWKTVKSGLSAGRVQSVAVKLIVDRHREIGRFVPAEYWNIDATLSPAGTQKKFKARYWGTDGKKVTVKTGGDADRIKAESAAAGFEIAKITKADKKRAPRPPFTTSSMQQEASRRLGFTAQRTMRAAQTLYEGVEIRGRGTLGLITYMRTDSLRISDEAYFAAKNFIGEKYGERYVPKYRRNFKSRANAQDAHEAIRPTNVTITPEEVSQSLSGDTARLYRLIWERFTASQMADCIQNTVNADIASGRHTYKASGYTVVFDGFTALYEEATDDKKEKETALPEMDDSTKLKASKVETEQKFTQPPSEYTEATLIKALEENGIGRPSTYAPIITTIIDRGYVERAENKKLVPTPLGITINDILEQKFADIIDVKFSADMENELDKIGDGKAEWTDVMREFYSVFSNDLEKAEKEMDGQKVVVPDEVTDEICELCGRPMVIKTGRYGKFLACSGFPECKNTRRLVKHAKGTCPKCGKGMIELKSKRGRTFYACEDSAGCGFMSWEMPTDAVCPVCGKTLFRKRGKYAKPHCVNESCPEYVPDAKRVSKPGEKADEGAEKAETKTTRTRKTAAKTTDTAAKKTTRVKKSETAEKTRTKKTEKAEKTVKKARTKKTETAAKTTRAKKAESADSIAADIIAKAAPAAKKTKKKTDEE